MNQIAMTCREEARKLEEKQTLNRHSAASLLIKAAQEIERLEEIASYAQGFEQGIRKAFAR